MFHKFRIICIKTILWTRNANCFTIFVHRNLRRNGIQSCEYHIVPGPRKWGFKALCSHTVHRKATVSQHPISAFYFHWSFCALLYLNLLLPALYLICHRISWSLSSRLPPLCERASSLRMSGIEPRTAAWYAITLATQMLQLGKVIDKSHLLTAVLLERELKIP